MASASWGPVPSWTQAHVLSKDRMWRSGGCRLRSCSSTELREADFLSTRPQGVLGEMASRGGSAPRSRDCVSSPSGARVALIQPVNSGIIGKEEEPEVRPQSQASGPGLESPVKKCRIALPAKGSKLDFTFSTEVLLRVSQKVNEPINQGSLISGKRQGPLLEKEINFTYF